MLSELDPAQIQRQQLVIAYNRDEAFHKGEAVRRQSDLGVPGDVAASTLDRILWQWKGFGTPWETLNGVRVLDLASGSGLYSTRLFGKYETTWYPHFSRFCAINGAEVVALDLYPQDGIDKILFTSSEVDLVSTVLKGKLSDLEILKGKKFDIIHSQSFIGRSRVPSLEVCLAERWIELPDFEKALLNQAGDLLSEGGVMTLDTGDSNGRRVFYTRKDGELVSLR